MSRLNREIEHLFGLLGGGDIGDDTDGAISLLNFITYFEVTCADPM